MKTPNKIVIANLRQNKKRTSATLIAIILSCTLLFAVGIAYSSYNQYNINKTAKKTGTYHVMYYDVDYQKTKDYLDNNKKVKDYYLYQEIDSITLDGNYSYLSYEGKIPILAYSDAFNEEITIKSGRLPENDSEIILPYDTVLYSLSKSLGDKLGEYTIVGTYKNGIISDLSIGTSYKSVVLALTKKEIDENNQHSSFLIYYKNKRKTYDNVQEDIINLGISNSSAVNVQINKDYLAEFGIGQNNGVYVILYCLYAFILFILSVFCMLIIYNAFSISLNERKKQFGVLRSVGTSKSKIIGMITKELMLLAIISLPISFGIGTGLIAIGLKITNQLNASSIPLGFDLITILITIFFIIFCMALSAYTPGKKASNTSPMEAIRNTRDYKIKNSKKQFNLTKKIFGAEGQLARKNLKRNGKQFGTVVTSLTISLTLFILTSTIVGLFTRAFGLESYDNRGYDTFLYIDSESKGDYNKFVEDVENLDTVDEVIEATRIYAEFDYDNSDLVELSENKVYREDLKIYVFKDEYFNQLISEYHLKENRPILRNIGLYSIMSKDGGYSTSSNYTFNPFKDNPTIHYCEFTDWDESATCDLEFKDLNIITEGINPDTEGEAASLMMSESQFNEIYAAYPTYFNDPYSGSDTPEMYATKYLYIKTSNIREYDKEIKNLLNNNSSMLVTIDSMSLDYYNEKMLMISILLALYSIIIFIGIISISGIINSINNNLNLREREFAMLRSTGFSKKGLNKMIKLENIFLIMKSLLATLIIVTVSYIGLNILLNIDIENVVINTPIRFYFAFPWLYTIIAFIVVIILILFLTSFSINKIKNQNIIEAIRKDSI